MYDLHGTQCNFVHRRIIGAVGGFITGGPTGAIAGAFRGGAEEAPTPLRPRSVFRPPVRSAAPRAFAAGACPPGQRRTSGGTCVRDTRIARVVKTPGLIAFGQRLVPGGATGLEVEFGQAGQADARAGEAVMGRYGAGLEPIVEARSVSTCLPGMVLGNDDICYNRGQVPNRSRMWPKGRKPLLTGGEMNAITKASRAARRVKATTKKLQGLGLLDKPKARRAAHTPHVPQQHTH